MRFLHTLCQLAQFVRFGASSVHARKRILITCRLFRARIGLRKKSATSFGELLVLIDAILRIPQETSGDIAEFGCFKGMASTAMSIAAKHAGRRLLIFDSFEGLPEPKIEIHNLGTGQRLDYRKGDYAGTLNEVRAAIAKYGEIGCCEFVKGFYADTLPLRPKAESYAMIFEDADLVESVEDVLRHAWPRLADGAVFFCHEARDLEVVKLFYDDRHWQAMHGCPAPGLVGAGLGLPIDAMNQDAFKFGRNMSKGSCLAYTRKPR